MVKSQKPNAKSEKPEAKSEKPAGARRKSEAASPKKETASPKAEARTQKAQDRSGKTIRVKQVRSGIGCPPAMRETLKAIGLRRMHQVIERKDSPEVRGMIAKIPHLVELVD